MTVSLTKISRFVNGYIAMSLIFSSFCSIVTQLNNCYYIPSVIVEA